MPDIQRIKAVLDITPLSFSVTVIKSDTATPIATVEEQTLDPRLGLYATSSSAMTLVNALNQVIALGTGRDNRVLMLAQSLRDFICEAARALCTHCYADEPLKNGGAYMHANRAICVASILREHFDGRL